MSGQSKIKIIDVNTEEELYSFNLDDMDKAYATATHLESIGLDIQLKIPTITDTLATELNLNMEDENSYRQSVLAEIEDHEGSCCHSLSDESTTKSKDPHS